MSDAALATLEPALRVAAFSCVAAAVAIWEARAPCRSDSPERAKRWPHNFGLLAVDVVVMRLVAPGAAVAVALAAEASGFGLLNRVELPAWMAVGVAVALLDLSLYLQHVLFHAVPVLWRLHRVHHADVAFDVTTGVRFHPLEIMLSMAIKCAAVGAIGAPADAVLAFEVLLNAASLFNHANASLPPSVERALRWLVVTPDMHRVHHSVRCDESSSNFGFSLPWWDRLFGTYRAAPAGGHARMVVGLETFRGAEDRKLVRLLAQPFRATPRAAPAQDRHAAA